MALQFRENPRSSGLSASSNPRAILRASGLNEASEAEAEAAIAANVYMSPRRVAHYLSEAGITTENIRRSLLIDPFLIYMPFGTSFSMDPSIPDDDDFPMNRYIVAGGSWGPGTGGSGWTATVSRVTLDENDLSLEDFPEFFGCKYAMRVTWDGPSGPTNGEGRDFDTAYFSNVAVGNFGSASVCGRTIVHVAAVRSNRAISIRAFYADPHGPGNDERLLPSEKFALPGDSAFHRYETEFTPDAMEATATQDFFNAGFGISTDDFTGVTYPLIIDYLFDLYPLEPIVSDRVDLTFETMPQICGNIRRPNGAIGYTMPGGKIRFIIDFSNNTMGGGEQPQVYKIAAATPGVLLGDEVFLGTGNITASNSLGKDGGFFESDGWGAIPSGEVVWSNNWFGIVAP